MAAMVPRLLDRYLWATVQTHLTFSKTVFKTVLGNAASAIAQVRQVVYGCCIQLLTAVTISDCGRLLWQTTAD
jgi:hypothetical protein